jgi:uncharacterized protein
VTPSLGAIHRYPVKSCRGAQVRSAVVEPWGLAGDRRWLVVDEDGRFRTARELREMLLIDPVPTAAGLTLSAPDAATIEVPTPTDGDLVPVTVWRSTVDAMLAAPEAHAWLTAVLGRPSRLVHLDDPTRRATNPDWSRPDDRVSFADGYPLLLTTSGSLDELNRLIDLGPRADEGPLPMVRFRPNVVVDGTPAWAEDGWRRVRIGAAEFRVIKGCARCAIPLTDPDTARRGKEPIATLARHRRWDGETWFGMNLIPDTPGVEIRVGDEVEILAAEPAPDGPPR